MNIANLNILLQEAIDNASNTTDLLLLAKAVQALNVGQIRSVSTFANLPAAASNEGLLVFVEADERLYWSTGAEWYNLVDETKGILWAWGSNESGELGDTTVVNKSSPVSVIGGFTDWWRMDGGANHTIGIRSNGTLWAWGTNANGQLGTGTTGSTSSPMSVIGGFTDWCQVSAGGDHTLAIRRPGTLWAWGRALFGQIGDGTTTDRSSPVSVVGGFTDWCQVSAGSRHSLAVRQNGTAWAWGSNSDGRLGDGTTAARTSPVSVVGGFTDWCQASAGNYHSLGLRSNGTLWAWGSNSSGQLGNNTTISTSSPVSVVGGFTDWCQISAGTGSHSLALRRSGTLWAWGINIGGRLGDGTNVAKSSPVSVIGGFTDWCQVSAGGVHSAGVRTNGSLWLWGDGQSGIVGNNSTSASLSPVSVVGNQGCWSCVSLGDFHSLAIAASNFT